MTDDDERHEALRQAAAFVREYRDEPNGRGSAPYYAFLAAADPDAAVSAAQVEERRRSRLFANALAEVVTVLRGGMPGDGQYELAELEASPERHRWCHDRTE